MPKKITSLTESQKARFSEWSEKWINIGLSTDRADFEKFEKAARRCYVFAGLRNDVPVIRVSSPMVGALAAPIAAQFIEIMKKNPVNSAVDSAVGSAVDSAVYSAVYSAVDSAVDSAVNSAVYSAVYSAVDS